MLFPCSAHGFLPKVSVCTNFFLFLYHKPETTEERNRLLQVVVVHHSGGRNQGAFVGTTISQRLLESTDKETNSVSEKNHHAVTF